MLPNIKPGAVVSSGLVAVNSNPYGLTMIGGAGWLPADYNSGNGLLPPAGFTDWNSMLQYFGGFSMGVYVGGFGVDPNDETGPFLGIEYVEGTTPTGSFIENFGFLYVPIRMSSMGRQFLMQYIVGLLLGPNIGPLPSRSQIAANNLEYVAISLDTAQAPASSYNAAIVLEPWMDINMAVFP